jgi:hypothetical protein
MTGLPKSGDYFVQKLLELGRLVRYGILTARSKLAAARGAASLAAVSKHTSADTIYQLDTQVEPVIVQYCEHWARELPMVLIAEGIEDERGREGIAVFPPGTAENDAQVRIIMDPIDGTRGLMYDKRSAWFLAGVAPNKGPATRLSDIQVAVQVELPTSKQTLADLLWAVRGHGAHGIREEVRGTVFQKSHDLILAPSTADNIDHGFAMISNFFPGTKELASRLMERIVEVCLGDVLQARGIVFDDQYIATGGQLYELMMGHDRMNADLRPLFYQIRHQPIGMCVHPYDMSAVLIAQEAGVEITDGLGGALDGPLDVESPLHWAGFANKALRARVEPVMRDALRQWLSEKG